MKWACHDTLLAEQRFALAKKAIELNRQLLAVTRERLAAGDIPELEMNLVKVELARSEVAGLDAAGQQEQSRSKLWMLMGLTDAPPMLAGIPGNDPPVGRTCDELQRLALSIRPDLKALEVEKARGEAEIRLAEAEGIPNLTAGLVVRRDATQAEVGGVQGRDTAYTMGVRLTMPIPLFDRNQAGVQEARARRASTETRLTAARISAEREVEAAWSIYQNSGKLLSLYRSEILPQLDENLKLTLEAYRLGEVGLLSVLQEQKKFFEVSDGQLTALHNRLTALVNLETAAATELTGGR